MATAAAKLKKKRPAAVNVRVVSDDDEVEQFLDAPLFEVVDGKRVDSIHVERTDPDEGTLGKCPPHFTELDIKRRWGGGTFKLQARDEKNRPMKGGFRTITISGDPLFESAIAQKKWQRQQGVDAGASNGSSPAFGEVMTLLKSGEQAARVEAEKRLTETQQRHALDMAKLEAEAKIRAQERRDEDERRERERLHRDERDKKDREERDERLRKEAEDREDRRRREDEAARVRDREFSLTLAQLQKSGRSDVNPTDMLIKGIELAQKVAGGDLDPLSELARNIPGILQTGKELIRPGAKADDDKTLLLEGALGLKALQLVEHFKRNGLDPADALGKLFDHVLGLGVQGGAQQQAAPAAGGAAPAAAASPPPAAPAPAAAAPAAPAAPAAGPAAPEVTPINSRPRRRRV